jgi:OFA family oxalate/formate antiporter-like MFS transporter
MAASGWSNSQVSLAFSLAICFLGIAAAWGGINLAKYGPRKLAMLGGALFGCGYLIAALALHLHWLWLWYAGYGVIGGIGLGLGYVTPVATAAKWFPDKKGLVTGMVVMGFGFGALLMSKVLAPALVSLTHGNYVLVFAWLGVVFLPATLAMASGLRNPPAGYVPPGWSAPAAASTGRSCADLQHDRLSCLLSARFGMMWIVFFCNITAGIAIITFQSPLLQDVCRKADPSLSAAALAGYGATLIAVSSLFNGVGRFFWGGLSDRIGRVRAFRIMLASQIVVFAALMYVGNPWLFGILICYILLCYGGGFGTMPSFVMDVFGARMMAVVYGVILTAWSAAGIAGPQIFAFVKDKFPLKVELASTYSFVIAAGFLGLGLLCSLAGRNDEAFRCGKSLTSDQPGWVRPKCGGPCLEARPAE